MTKTVRGYPATSDRSRASDEARQATSLLERRKASMSGAQGIWASKDDKLTMLDTNEGYASRLIGSPETILHRMLEFHRLGIDCFHLNLRDDLFNREVLPALPALDHEHAEQPARAHADGQHQNRRWRGQAEGSSGMPRADARPL